jgi:hypothetical protein
MAPKIKKNTSSKAKSSFAVKAKKENVRDVDDSKKVRFDSNNISGRVN